MLFLSVRPNLFLVQYPTNPTIPVHPMGHQRQNQRPGAEDLETLVSQVLPDFPYTGFADGLFVMTTVTDHNISIALPSKKTMPAHCELKQSQFSRWNSRSHNGRPTKHRILERKVPPGWLQKTPKIALDGVTVGLTRAKSLTLVVSPLDMTGLIGMAQVLATLAYGLKGLRRGDTTWDWPTWMRPPLAIANKCHDHRNNQTRKVGYRLIFSTSFRPRLATKRQTQRPATKSGTWPRGDSKTTPPLRWTDTLLRLCRRPHVQAYICLPPVGLVRRTNRTHPWTIGPISRNYTTTRYTSSMGGEYIRP